jgi:AGCS family alanine or glycine:cation symporter
MQNLEIWSQVFVDLIWGLPIVILLVGSGVFFSFYFGLPQITYFKHAIDVVRGKFDKESDKGEISHFQALATALSGTLGLGNIAGVSIGLAIAGPGAVFWLWVAGFFGMTTKLAEVVLAVKYREISADGTVHGGPMYTIKNALSKKFFPLAWMYAFFSILSSFGAGNMFQANQMASVIETSLGVPLWVTGLFFAFLAGLILIGGIKRIASVTSRLVPLMVFLYFGGTFVIVCARFEMIPEVLKSIFEGAFTGTAAIGGFAGAALKDVIIMGVRRASFSNEAGMGTAAIAHAAARSEPAKEGVVALLEPFIDTIVVCTFTAVALLLAGAWTQSGVVGSEMTAVAFESVMGPWGRGIVTLSVALFAFATIISWSYYGEQGVNFVFGEKFITPYRYINVFFVFLGSVLKLNLVLNISDGVYGLLVIPNLLSLYLLAPLIKKELRAYGEKLK